MIDTSIYLHRWPFRRLPGDEPADLARKLTAAGVTQAWTGSFEAPLADDLAEVNARLAADCRRFGPRLFLPFGSVNPCLPDWREDLRRCAEQHRMRGIRLHPNYHGYTLAAPQFTELLAAAATRKLIVQIVIQMQDERTQHPAVRVAPAALTGLAAAITAAPGVRVLLSNLSRPVREDVRKLMGAGAVFTDFAMVEGIYGLRRLAEDAGAGRVVFGSFHPLYYFESALLKIRESGLDPRPFTHDNPRALLAGAAAR